MLSILFIALALAVSIAFIAFCETGLQIWFDDIRKCDERHTDD